MVLVTPMRDLYTELWGKESPSDIIEEFTIEVPKPQFCREPGFRAGAHDFPLTGALEQKTYQVLQKLQTPLWIEETSCH